MRAEHDREVFEPVEDDYEDGWEEWDELDDPEEEEGGEPAQDLTDPSLLREQRFILSLFGYDRAEVRSFLTHLADRLEKAPADTTSSGPAPSFEALGDEVARILQATTEAAEELRRRLLAEAQEARDEAAMQLARARERAEQEARAVTERAEERSRALVHEAERRATSIVQEAENEAERIRSTEEELRSRLAGMEEMLAAVRHKLIASEDEKGN